MFSTSIAGRRAVGNGNNFAPKSRPNSSSRVVSDSDNRFTPMLRPNSSSCISNDDNSIAPRSLSQCSGSPDKNDEWQPAAKTTAGAVSSDSSPIRTVSPVPENTIRTDINWFPVEPRKNTEPEEFCDSDDDDEGPPFLVSRNLDYDPDSDDEDEDDHFCVSPVPKNANKVPKTATRKSPHLANKKQRKSKKKRNSPPQSDNVREEKKQRKSPLQSGNVFDWKLFCMIFEGSRKAKRIAWRHCKIIVKLTTRMNEYENPLSSAAKELLKRGLTNVAVIYVVLNDDGTKILKVGCTNHFKKRLEYYKKKEKDNYDDANYVVILDLDNVTKAFYRELEKIHNEMIQELSTTEELSPIPPLYQKFWQEQNKKPRIENVFSNYAPSEGDSVGKLESYVVALNKYKTDHGKFPSMRQMPKAVSWACNIKSQNKHGKLTDKDPRVMRLKEIGFLQYKPAEQHIHVGRTAWNEEKREPWWEQQFNQLKEFVRNPNLGGTRCSSF